MPKTGRNDPCPCGSGKKYKHCCLAKDQAAELATLSAMRAELDAQRASRPRPYPGLPSFTDAGT